MARGSEYQDEEVMAEKKYLTPLRVGALQALPEDTYLIHGLEVELQRIGGRMAAQLMTKVMTETISEHTKTLTFTFEFEVPASWWDDFKEHRMPAWFIQRFPIRYKHIRKQRVREVSFRQFVKYPNFRAVPHDHEMFPVMEATINPVWKEAHE